MPSNLLEGRVALITGGANGIGAKVAELFQEQGATVIVTDTCGPKGRDPSDTPGQTGNSFYLDVADPEGWQIVMEAIREDFSGLDILVNHFPAWQPPTLSSENLKQYMETMRQYQGSIHLGVSGMLPIMQSRNSPTIINVSTADDEHTLEPTDGQCSVLWSLQAASRAWTRKLDEQGVRINLVHSRKLDNPSVTAANQESQIESVARTVLFLASGLSGNASGCEYVLR